MAIQTNAELNEIGSVEAPQTLMSADLSAQGLMYNTTHYLLPFVISLAIFLVVVSGLSWVTAMGNDHKINKAKMMIKMTIAAVLLAILSFAVIKAMIQFFF